MSAPKSKQLRWLPYDRALDAVKSSTHTGIRFRIRIGLSGLESESLVKNAPRSGIVDRAHWLACTLARNGNFFGTSLTISCYFQALIE